jgi:Fe-S-cluster-containing dehydrogenase component
MADIDKKEAGVTAEGLSRRQFVTGVGGAGAGLVLGGMLVKGFILPKDVFAVPASQGYLLVDTSKCSTCTSCMLTCSMAHYGRSSLSLSRIQVLNNPFGKYPDDVTQYQCRQCPYPACVEACPTGANHIDAGNGNVRTVDADKCIGCERCVQACPFTPSRMQWNFEDKHAQKCDLCADTPFWDEQGGPGGKQICIQVCPHNAISFTSEVPLQSQNGYVVNLRGDDSWGKFGFPVSDDGMKLAPSAAPAASAH